MKLPKSRASPFCVLPTAIFAKESTAFMTLLLSIPVHEWPESFADQLANIATFAPRSFVVAHVSLSSASGHYEAFHRAAFKSPHADRTFLFGEIWSSEWTVWACHVAAFQFAERIGLPYTHFAMEASNSLFVRGGVEDHISKHGAGLVRSNTVAGSGWGHECAVLNDRDSIKVAARGFTLRAGQCEGAFFPRNTFRMFTDQLREIGYDYPHPARGWPQEEVWPATFLPEDAPTRQFTYVPWHDASLIPSAEYVREIAAGRVDGVYAVKRVPRAPGHWLRGMIRSIAASVSSSP